MASYPSHIMLTGNRQPTTANWQLRLLTQLILVLVFLGLAAQLLPRLVTGLYAGSRLFTAESVPPERAAIVFGAGLRHDGSPTAVLREDPRRAKGSI